MTTDAGDPRRAGAPQGAVSCGGPQDDPVPTRVPLRAALDAARQAFAAERPPPSLQPRVLAAMAAAHGQRRAAAPGGTSPGRAVTAGFDLAGWRWPAAAAFAVVLPLSIAVALLTSPARVDTRAVRADAGAVSSGFVPLPAADVLRRAAAPDEPAWVVTTEMPRERLGLLGLPYDPARAGESVRAELLMHGSGTVLAVRLVAQ